MCLLAGVYSLNLTSFQAKLISHFLVPSSFIIHQGPFIFLGHTLTRIIFWASQLEPYYCFCITILIISFDSGLTIFISSISSYFMPQYYQTFSSICVLTLYCEYPQIEKSWDGHTIRRIPRKFEWDFELFSFVSYFS